MNLIGKRVIVIDGPFKDVSGILMEAYLEEFIETVHSGDGNSYTLSRVGPIIYDIAVDNRNTIHVKSDFVSEWRPVTCKETTS
jgi:hypothetical protein